MAQDLVGQPVVEVIVEQEGQRVTDPVILALVQTSVGQPLSMTDVRETFDHLFALRRFDDIRPTAEPVAGGVRVRYVLMPSHPIDRIEFRGTVSVSESDLRRVVTDRFGRSPNPARAAEAALMLQTEYRRRGYPAASVAARVEPTHNPDRATLAFDINSGRRARIADVRFRYLDRDEASGKFALPDIRVGEPYDPQKVEETLAKLGRADAGAGVLSGPRQRRPEHAGRCVFDRQRGARPARGRGIHRRSAAGEGT